MTNVYLVQSVDNFDDEVYSTLDKVYSAPEPAFQEAKRRNTENYNEAVSNGVTPVTRRAYDDWVLSTGCIWVVAAVPLVTE